MINHNKFVCEISPNILYQYVLIILWFLIVFSIIISLSGLLINLIGHVVTVTCFLRKDNPAREIYRILTFRECEYLEMIRRHNIPIFGEILRKLQTDRKVRTASTFDNPCEEMPLVDNPHYDTRDKPLVNGVSEPNAPSMLKDRYI